MVESTSKCIYFRGKQHPFSNFYPSPMTINGQKYSTVEHYFQSQKFVGLPYEQKIIKASTPAEAKKLGSSRAYKLRFDWEEAKVNIMEKAVKEKFQQNPKLLEKLLETEDQKIVENALNDNYWGCGKKKTGKNMLGIILMKIRKEFKTL